MTSTDLFHAVLYAMFFYALGGFIESRRNSRMIKEHVKRLDALFEDQQQRAVWLAKAFNACVDAVYSSGCAKAMKHVELTIMPYIREYYAQQPEEKKTVPNAR